MFVVFHCVQFLLV